jgi:mevalonate kinase
MSDLLWPSDGDNLGTFEKSMSFAFTQHLGYVASPVRGEATSRAAGKVILVGEHAVVYGAKAIAIPLLSRNMKLHIYTDRVTNQNPKIKFQIAGQPVHQSLIDMIHESFEVLQIPKFNLSIDGQSTLMLGAGVGSSASLCVSVIRGLCQVCGISLTPAKLSALANRLERRFHGNPSGLDTAVVALEQAILFERGRDAEAITINKPKNSSLPWCFVLLDTAVRSPTINMVKLSEPWFKQNGESAIRRFNTITDSTVRALRDGDTQLLSEAMTECHELLDLTGVVTDPVKRMIELARNHGALAAKVTGAGGGGCVLALLPASQCDETIANLRQQIGDQRIHPIFIP